MELDYFSPFQLPIFLLKLIGLWQDNSSSWQYQVYGLILHLFFDTYSAAQQTWYIVHSVLSRNVTNVSKSLNITCTLYAIEVKSVWLILKLRKLKEMFETLDALIKMSSFGRQAQRTKLQKKAKKMKIMAIIYYVMTVLAVSASAISGLARFRERVLPHDTRLFYDIKKNDFNYWFSMVFQFFASFVGSAINYSCDVTAVIFIGYASAIVDELSTEVELIMNGEEEDNKESSSNDVSRLYDCIECHVKSKEFVIDISRHLSFVILIQSLMSAVILCTSAFLLTNVSHGPCDIRNVNDSFVFPDLAAEGNCSLSENIFLQHFDDGSSLLAIILRE